MAFAATSYIKTGAAVATRNEDLLSFGLNAKWQSLSGYLRFIQVNTLDVSQDLWRIGVNAAGTTGTNTGFLIVDTSLGLYRLRGPSGNATVAVGGTIGDLIELWFTMTSAGVVAFSGIANGGAVTTSAGAFIMTAANFDVATIWFGHASGNKGTTAFRNALLCRGVLSLDSLRRYAGV